jgi:DNA mismatch repair protein MutS2
MNLNPDELVPVAETEIKNDRPFYHKNPLTVTNYRLDIRGRKPHECESEVLRFIDDAYSAGLDRIEILHGKGTGALKKMVKEILSEYENVKNYYFAPIESGGDGITIVELK